MNKATKLSIGIAGAAAMTAVFGAGGATEVSAAEIIPEVQGAQEESVAAAQAEPQDYYEAKEQEETAREVAEAAGAETAEARDQAVAAEEARQDAEADVRTETDEGQASEEAHAGAVESAQAQADGAAQAQADAAGAEEEARTVLDNTQNVTDAELEAAGKTAETAEADAADAANTAGATEAERSEAEKAAKQAADTVAEAEASKADAESALETANTAKSESEASVQETAEALGDARKDYEDALAARENAPDVTAEDVAAAEADAAQARAGKENADAGLKTAEDEAEKAATAAEADASAKTGAETKAKEAAEAEAEAQSRKETADEELKKAEEALDFYEKVRAGEAEIQDSTEYKALTEAQGAYSEADTALKNAEDVLAKAKSDEAGTKAVYDTAKEEAAAAKTAYETAKAVSDTLAGEAEALRTQESALAEEIAAATDAAKLAEQAKKEAAKNLKAAEKAVSDAQNALTALEEQVQAARTDAEAAQVSLEKAYAQYLDGAYGFYEWLAKNYTEKEEGYKYSTADLAEMALKVFNRESVAEYQNRGSIYDSTAVPAVQGAIRYMRECNEIRKAAGKDELNVDLTSMAVAQASLDYALVEEKHSPIAEYENLITFGTNDPYALWYYWEKENLESGNGQQTGHYYNIIRDYATKREYTINGKVIRTDEYEGVMGYATTFLPAGTYEGVDDVYVGHVQEFAPQRKGIAKTYTVDEFEDLFNTYLGTIDLEGKQAALNAASGVLDKAKAALEAGKTALASAQSARDTEKKNAEQATVDAKTAAESKAALTEQRAGVITALGIKEAETASAKAETDRTAGVYDTKVNAAENALADYNADKAVTRTAQAGRDQAADVLKTAAETLSQADKAYRALTSDDTMKALADNVAGLTKTATERAAELAAKIAARTDADRAFEEATKALAASETRKTEADSALAAAKQAAKTAADRLTDAVTHLTETQKAYALVTDIEGATRRAEEALKAAGTAYADAAADLAARTADVDAKESALADAVKAVTDAQALSRKAADILAEKVRAEELAKAAAETKAGDAADALEAYNALLAKRAAYDAARTALDQAVKNRETADETAKTAAEALTAAKEAAKADKEAHAAKLAALQKTLEEAKTAETAANAVYEAKNAAYISALADYNIAKGVTQSFLPMNYDTSVSAAEVTHLDGTPVSLATDSRETDIEGVFVDGVQVAQDMYSYDAATQTVSLTKDYIDSLAAGDHEVVIKYELGSGTASFAVKAVALTETAVEMAEEAVYTGQDIIPPVSVTYNGTELAAGRDYDVICTDNRNAGTATAVIRGINGFEGEEVKTFTIRPAELTTGDVGNFGTVFIAAGAPVTPEPVVTHDGRTLVRGTDYSVEYENNIKAGTGFLTVSGTGNYTGTIRTPFTLVAEEKTETPAAGGTASGTETSGKTQSGTGSGKSDVSKAANGVTAASFSIYRLYHPITGDHFYTASASEKNACVRAGWKSEGVCSKQPAKGAKAVYRLYNPNTGEHLFTMDRNERKTLTAKGWVYEGHAFYSDPDKGTPVYRLYNKSTGKHHYTAHKNEFDYLVKHGWKGEGIAWYGLSSK